MTRPKVCFKCLSEKPISDFYPHPRMGDGYLNKCKECSKRDSTEYRNANIAKIRAYDSMRSKRPERAKAAAQIAKLWLQQDKRRPACHNAVHRAIKKGVIERKDCERCGSPKTLAHHESYDNKLDVNWLCQPCHKQRHKEMAIHGIEP